MSLYVARPGLLTTVQDLGRYGYQRYGVAAGGAMDPFALRMANLLVGNDEGEGALEMTVTGPELRFEADCLISICGGNLQPVIQGAPVPMWRPVFVKQGNCLNFGNPLSGCRSYMAVAGGFQLPRVMGSMSTYLRAGIGGFAGRALQAGDSLHLRPPSDAALRRMDHLASGSGNLSSSGSPFTFARWAISPLLFPAYGDQPVIRVVRGGQYDLFTGESQKRFWNGVFTVTPKSDRMGYRLKGPGLACADGKELISEAVGNGSVQVPADGNPIVLLADRQTIGGYPKIADVISVDLPVLAQVRPGAAIRFKEVSLEEAHELYRKRETDIRLVKQALAMKE